MYEVIKNAVERLGAILRVRNSHQLRGPTLLRTNAPGRGPKQFRLKHDQFQDRSDALQRW